MKPSSQLTIFRNLENKFSKNFEQKIFISHYFNLRRNEILRNFFCASNIGNSNRFIGSMKPSSQLTIFRNLENRFPKEFVSTPRTKKSSFHITLIFIATKYYEISCASNIGNSNRFIGSMKPSSQLTIFKNLENRFPKEFVSTPRTKKSSFHITLIFIATKYYEISCASNIGNSNRFIGSMKPSSQLTIFKNLENKFPKNLYQHLEQKKSPLRVTLIFVSTKFLVLPTLETRRIDLSAGWSHHLDGRSRNN